MARQKRKPTLDTSAYLNQSFNMPQNNQAVSTYLQSVLKDTRAQSTKRNNLPPKYGSTNYPNTTKSVKKKKINNI